MGEGIELLKIVLTASLTVIGSTVVFVLGQYTLKFLIDPILEIKSAIVKIDYDLHFYRNKLSSQTEDKQVIQKILREDCCKLVQALNASIFYQNIYKLFKLPPSDDILLAVPLLIGISNDVGSNDQDVQNTKTIRIIRIRELLMIPHAIT